MAQPAKKVCDSAPPAAPVRWRVRVVGKRRRGVIVHAQFWQTARQMGASLLGVRVDQVEAEQVANGRAGQ